MLRLLIKTTLSGITAIVVSGCLEQPVSNPGDTIYTGINANPSVVSEPNEAPVAYGLRINAEEDSTVNQYLSGNDPEGAELTYELDTQPAKGTVIISDRSTGAFIYTPAANANGLDSFTFHTSDGKLSSASATVTISIAPKNDAPVAVDDNVTTKKDTTLTINNVLANDNDVDGDGIAVASYTQPSHGQLQALTTGFVYTPNVAYAGSDSFTYTIADGNGGQSTATVNIVIQANNNSPIAVSDDVFTDEDTTIVIDNVLANDSDPDSDTLSVTGVTQASHGSVNMNAGVITYTPNTNFSGMDSFTYNIEDSQGGRAVATVNVSVKAINDIPVAQNDTVTTDEDKSVVINNVLDNDTDADNDTLSLVSVAPPSHGTVVKNSNGTLTYAPLANFNGNDSFQYTVADGNGGVATGLVTITVRPVNDQPLAAQDLATTERDKMVVVDVLANDSGLGDGPVTVSTSSAPTNGTAKFNVDSTITYTPNAGFIGTDSFNYTITDADGETTVADVQIDIICSAPCEHRIQVSWLPNSETDIAGYMVYHGNQSGTYSDKIFVIDATSFEFVTTDTGPHYFAISALDIFDNESSLSLESSATILQ